MVDLHSHVLWGLDDGAATREESVAMVTMAAAAGTTDLVATPHASPHYEFQPAVTQQRAQEVYAASGSAVRIHTGCDFHLDFDHVQDALQHPRKYTINQKQYLLVEFADLIQVKSSGEALQRLQVAGMIPIITHPERNRFLQKHPEHLEQWVQQGCLVQITGQALLGQFGNTAREYADMLLRQDRVHFVASDAHNCDHRPPSLREAYALVQDRCGAARAQALFVDQPRRVIQGEAWPVPVASAKKKSWLPWR